MTAIADALRALIDERRAAAEEGPLMHWTALVTAHQLYNQHEKYDVTYRTYLNDPDGPDWWGPDAPTAPQVDRVLRFVNQWKSRVKRDPQTVAQLRVGLLRAKNLLQPLRRRTILDVDYDEGTIGAVAGALDAILESLPTRNATAASKILHMFNPRLFVMWDQAIRTTYGVGPGGISYAKLFLPQMQVEAQEAITTFTDDGEAKAEKAVFLLEVRCDGRPLAKLVDEYNWWTFVGKMDATVH